MASPHRLSLAWFRWLHDSRLIYNACWEDPRLDREALRLTPDDVVVMITSAGCNALDYALDRPRHIHAVDMNPRQNALLELKQAGIRALDHETFFDLFGRGRTPRFAEIYGDVLRAQLSPGAQRYWDRHGHYFRGGGWRPSFYFHGTTGFIARAVNGYLDAVGGVRSAVERLLAAASVAEQHEIYFAHIRDRLWRPLLRWTLGRDALLSMLAVPRPQRDHLERNFGGIAGFIESRVEAVFTRLPIRDNYFWRVYLTGAYTRDCCPGYLQRDGFLALKAGLVDRVTTHHATLLDFLGECGDRPTRLVLLDHMDWLCDDGIDVLRDEWQRIVDRAAPGARILWRSGGTHTRFVDRLQVRDRQGASTHLGRLLRYDRALATRLHAADRVHTYGSFHVAEVLA